MPRIMMPVVPDYMRGLGRRLSKLGLSWVELARETAIAQTQLSRWKNQRMQPSWENIVRLEQGLDRIKRRRGLTKRPS